VSYFTATGCVESSSGDSTHQYQKSLGHPLVQDIMNRSCTPSKHFDNEMSAYFTGWMDGSVFYVPANTV